MYNKLTAAFLELRDTSIGIYSEESMTEATQKYDMLFLGENFDSISSSDLHDCLKNYFNIDIDYNEFIKLIPEICKSLSMTYQPFKTLATNDIYEDIYFINLQS